MLRAVSLCILGRSRLRGVMVRFLSITSYLDLLDGKTHFFEREKIAIETF